MKIINVLAISALVVGGQPLVSEILPGAFGDTGKAAAKNGPKKPKKAKKTDRGRSVGGGKPAHAGGPKIKTTGNGNAGATRAAAYDDPALIERRQKNLHALLKGMNSLNRNINGLMNSSDRKMDGFRAMVLAGADHEAALEELKLAQESFDMDASDYLDAIESLGLNAPTSDAEFDALLADLTALASAPQPEMDDYLLDDGSLDDAAYQLALTDWTASATLANAALLEHGGVQSSWQDLQTAADTAEGTGDGVSEEALIQALLDGLNATGAGPVTESDLTPEMIEWASDKMGLGDAEGLIDDYLLMGTDDSANLGETPLDPRMVEDGILVDGT